MSNDWIDAEGFRANVGIILVNAEKKLMLGGRVGAKGWQFPQGGIDEGEAPEEAMYRELREEVGLEPGDVDVLGVTSDWLRYRLPDRYIRKNSRPLCIGQKQRWFIMRLTCDTPEELLAALDRLDDWPAKVKLMQANWIGRSPEHGIR